MYLRLFLGIRMSLQFPALWLEAGTFDESYPKDFWDISCLLFCMPKIDQAVSVIQRSISYDTNHHVV